MVFCGHPADTLRTPCNPLWLVWVRLVEVLGFGLLALGCWLLPRSEVLYDVFIEVSYKPHVPVDESFRAARRFASGAHGCSSQDDESVCG